MGGGVLRTCTIVLLDFPNSIAGNFSVRPFHVAMVNRMKNHRIINRVESKNRINQSSHSLLFFDRSSSILIGLPFISCYDFRITSEGGFFQYMNDGDGNQIGARFVNPIFAADGNRVGSNQGYTYYFPPQSAYAAASFPTRTFYFKDGTITFVNEAIVAASGAYEKYITTPPVAEQSVRLSQATIHMRQKFGFLSQMMQCQRQSVQLEVEFLHTCWRLYAPPHRR